MTVTNFYNDGGIYNEIIINGDNAVIHANEKKPLTGAVEEAEAEEVPVAPTLIKYIFDDEKRAKVATALKTCTDAKSLTITLERLNEEKIFKLSQMIDASFRESIMPLLGFKTSDEAIRKIIERANIV